MRAHLLIALAFSALVCYGGRAAEAETLGGDIGDPYRDGLTAFAGGDYGKALALLTPLADRGNLKAMTIVGGIYVGGFGVEKDCAKGEPLVMRAAQAGYARAQYDMGRFTGTGWCGPINPKESFAWYLKAAKQRDPDAAFSVGLAYAEGSATPIDVGEAYCWFRASLKFFDESYPSTIDPAASFLKNKRAAEKNIGLLEGGLSTSQRERAKKLLCLTGG